MANILHTSEGVIAPAFTPTGINQHYTDTVSGITYVSVGTSDAGDWQAVGSGGGGLSIFTGVLSGSTLAIPIDTDLAIIQLDTTDLSNNISLPEISTLSVGKTVIRVQLYSDAPGSLYSIQFNRTGTTDLFYYSAGYNAASYTDRELSENSLYVAIANPVTNKWVVYPELKASVAGFTFDSTRVETIMYDPDLIDVAGTMTYTIMVDTDRLHLYRNSADSAKDIEITLPNRVDYRNTLRDHPGKSIIQVLISGDNVSGASKNVTFKEFDGASSTLYAPGSSSGAITLAFTDGAQSDLYTIISTGSNNDWIIEKTTAGIPWIV